MPGTSHPSSSSPKKPTADAGHYASLPSFSLGAYRSAFSLFENMGEEIQQSLGVAFSCVNRDETYSASPPTRAASSAARASTHFHRGLGACPGAFQVGRTACQWHAAPKPSRDGTNSPGQTRCVNTNTIICLKALLPTAQNHREFSNTKINASTNICLVLNGKT